MYSNSEEYLCLPTTLALSNMIHEWTKATDSTGDAIRVVLLHYRMASDFVGHGMVAQKVFQLHISLSQ